MRHIARSVDRLLTYAEGNALSERQLAELKTELDMSSTQESLFTEVETAFAQAAKRIRRFSPESLEQPRAAGKKALPTTVGGVLVHVADHTQRHVGQAIITANLVSGSSL